MARQLIALLVLVFSTMTAQAASQLYYIHTDHLGTPQVVTDSNQAVVWEGRQMPFGEFHSQQGVVTQPLRFPGQYADQETGFHYNYFRDYDPITGRYVQSDPIGLEGGINTYGYAYQNPLVYTDSLGLAAVQCALYPHAPNCGPTESGGSYGGGGGAVVDLAKAGSFLCHLFNLCGPNVYNNEDASDDSRWCPDSDEVPELDWDDPSKPPVSPDGTEWPWRGPDAPGGKRGGYVNPDNPDVSVHPDLDHAPPVGPHWDYTDRKKGGARVYPDGSVKSK